MEPRLEQYLAEQGLTGQTQQIMPLTGDASDRRYFRVLLKDARPIVLALHAGPIDVSTMPFVAIARLLSDGPVPAQPRIRKQNASPAKRDRKSIAFPPLMTG